MGYIRPLGNYSHEYNRDPVYARGVLGGLQRATDVVDAVGDLGFSTGRAGAGVGAGVAGVAGAGAAIKNFLTFFKTASDGISGAGHNVSAWNNRATMDDNSTAQQLQMQQLQLQRQQEEFQRQQLEFQRRQHGGVSSDPVQTVPQSAPAPAPTTTVAPPPVPTPTATATQSLGEMRVSELTPEQAKRAQFLLESTGKDTGQKSKGRSEAQMDGQFETKSKAALAELAKETGRKPEEVLAILANGDAQQVAALTHRSAPAPVAQTSVPAPQPTTVQTPPAAGAAPQGITVTATDRSPAVAELQRAVQASLDHTAQGAGNRQPAPAPNAAFATAPLPAPATPAPQPQAQTVAMATGRANYEHGRGSLEAGGFEPTPGSGLPPKPASPAKGNVLS